MELPSRCPICNFPFSEAKESGFIPPAECPYAGAAYPELCSLHDKIYFGRWRKMDADAHDIVRGYRKIVHLLSAVGRAAAEEKDERAVHYLKQAGDVLARTSPEDDPYGAVKFLDRALSYAHHAINELIRRRGGRPHNPSDYEMHYDVVPPFTEGP